MKNEEFGSLHAYAVRRYTVTSKDDPQIKKKQAEWVNMASATH